MMEDRDRLLRAAQAKLDELQKRAQEYTTSRSPDPVRIAVYHYQFVGAADIVAAIESEMRAIAAERDGSAAAAC